MATDFVKKIGKLPTFVSLSFRNGIGYRYLSVRINSANNASISCENFLKFTQVTPELTESSFVNIRYDTGISRRISLDILDRFSQSFHHIKALYVQMINLDLIFSFRKGCCHGNEIILP